MERFHPWIFSGAVGKVTGNPCEGEVVSVYSHDGALLGCGHYQIGSIAVRILSFESERIDDSFWKERIEAAWGKYHEKWFKVTPEKLSEMILTDAKAEVDAYLESVRTGHDPRPPWWEVRP